MQPTAEYVKKRLNYDPETGNFTWKKRPESDFKNKGAHKTWNKKYENQKAGTTNSCGYVVICLNYKSRLAHRLAWLITTNEWPQQGIDHKDGEKTNNSISNLRNATQTQNGQNSKIRKNNKCGIKGLDWREANKKWRAAINVKGKRTSKVFNTIQEAESWIKLKRKELHKDFTNHG